MTPQKRGCSSVAIQGESSFAKIPKVVLTKIDSQTKNFDFNAIAVVRLKRLWLELPNGKDGKNLLTNGIIKNTKRMRFQTKALTLDDEE